MILFWARGQQLVQVSLPTMQTLGQESLQCQGLLRWHPPISGSQRPVTSANACRQSEHWIKYPLCCLVNLMLLSSLQETVSSLPHKIIFLSSKPFPRQRNGEFSPEDTSCCSSKGDGEEGRSTDEEGEHKARDTLEFF